MTLITTLSCAHRSRLLCEARRFVAKLSPQPQHCEACHQPLPAFALLNVRTRLGQRVAFIRAGHDRAGEMQ